MDKGPTKPAVRNLLQQAAAFIGRETAFPNESKRPIVVIRIIILSVMLYFSANLIICHSAIGIVGIQFYLVFLVLFIGIFAASYRLNTSRVLCIFYFSMIIWILFNLHMLGWNVGVQHFLVLLMLLVFFSFYGHYIFKSVQAALMCIFRILLYLVYLNHEPLWTLTSSNVIMLQVLNSITIFWCLSVMAFVFSKDCHELESKLVEYNVSLKKMANTDTLTGLYNRRMALDYLEDFIRKTNPSSNLSICICDIDHFKIINDTYGHDCGDTVLTRLSEILIEEMAEFGLAARWGGEEFLLIFPNHNGDEAVIALHHIREKIKAMRITHDGITFGISMTFGLVEYDFLQDISYTLVAADRNLYFGKENGRDQIVF